MKPDLVAYVDSCGSSTDGAVGFVVTLYGHVLMLGAMYLTRTNGLMNLESKGIELVSEIMRPFSGRYTINIVNDRLLPCSPSSTSDLCSYRTSVTLGNRNYPPVVARYDGDKQNAFIHWASMKSLFKGVNSNLDLLRRVSTYPDQAGMWLADKLGRLLYTNKIRVFNQEDSLLSWAIVLASQLAKDTYKPTLFEIVQEMYHSRYLDITYDDYDHNYIHDWFEYTNLHL